MIIKMAVNGREIRDTARVPGISKDTVMSVLKKLKNIVVAYVLGSRKREMLEKLNDTLNSLNLNIPQFIQTTILLIMSNITHKNPYSQNEIKEIK